MKNKFFLCACMVALTAAMFTSCKKHTDLTDVNTALAQKTIPGIYVYVGVDKENVSTTLYEWSLVDKNGSKTGYYRVASTGNGLDGDVKTDLTWSDATMSEDGLSMIVPVEVANQQKDLVWTDGVVKVDGYTTGKELISKAGVLRSLNSNFKNYTFEYNDTTSYITSRMDTMDYLAWKTDIVYWDLDSIEKYKQFLIDNADTIAWFNERYPDIAVPDTVRFAENPQTSGKYKGLYKGIVPLAYEAQEITEIFTNHGPLHIINSEFTVNRSADLVNTGTYKFHEQTWSELCYTHPDSAKATYTDYNSEVTNAKWTFSAFTNASKFNILYKGDWDMTLKESAGGKEDPEPVEMHEKNYFFEIMLSEYDEDEGVITLSNHVYKLKK